MDDTWSEGTPPKMTERGLPRANEPNDNPVPDPPVSVGPNASEGFGNTHVMYEKGTSPVGVQAWSGWPVNWDTPTWNGHAVMGAHQQLSDVAWAALDLNSSVLGSMPPYLVKDHQAVTDGVPPWLTNPEPLVYESWGSFAKEAFWSYQAVGEVFILATARYAPDGPTPGRPQRFMVVNPAYVSVDLVDGRREYRIAGQDVPREDVLHVKYASWPGDLRGHGPLEIAGARLLAANALTRYGSELANNGGLPPAIIKTPKRLQRAQLDEMRADWIQARRSALGVPAILTEGAELDSTTSYVRDMALVDLQRFSEARISVLLGVPPFLLGLPQGEGMTYSNVTSLFDYHWRASLRPKAQDFATALSQWALPAGTSLELNRDEYVRPGMFERAQSYQMLIGAGVLDPDEVRILERYQPRHSGAANHSAEALAAAGGDLTPPQGEPS